MELTIELMRKKIFLGRHKSAESHAEFISISLDLLYGVILEFLETKHLFVQYSLLMTCNIWGQ